MFQSTRFFKLWDYSVSHQQLLIRSPMTPDIATNIDIVLWGVKYFEIATILKGIDIARTQDQSRISEKAKRFIVDGYEGFVINSGVSNFVIVAAGFRVLENVLDIFESTITTANDADERNVGVELARS